MKIFMLSILFESHLIKHSGRRRAFKDTQRALEHLRHSESTWALGHSSTRIFGHLEGTQALGVHSEGTRALRYLRHLGTRTLRALRHSDTWTLKALGNLEHLGTWAIEHSRHSRTWAL